MITLRRAYLPFGDAAMGCLVVGDKSFATLELPWRANRPSASCIPEGVYTLRKRQSAVVTRSTAGEYSIGWEVTGVRGRDWIMLHPGNYVRDTDGCILPGRRFGWHPELGPMVTASRDAFRDLMGVLADREEWQIDIRCNCPEYP